MLSKISYAKKIICSQYYPSSRMEKMNRECAYYLEQMDVAKNGLMRKTFAKMALVYFKRYEYYLKKCTEDELGKSF